MRINKPLQLVISLLFGFFVLAQSAFSAIRYVRPVASGLGNGSSWANASSDLQAMINASSNGDDIWVAAGTYLPIRRADDVTGPLTLNDRNNAFVLKYGVRLYGGFVGTETLLSQRDWSINQTNLSGNIGIVGIKTDNCFHVVISAGDVGTAALDGFIISQGNANGNSGIYINSIVIGNYDGGGIVIRESSPELKNCVFSYNNALRDGGGCCMLNSLSVITSCKFLFNGSMSEPSQGGGMSNTSSTPIITDCIFQENGSYSGGGMYNSYSNPTITGCIFSGNNSAGSGGGVLNVFSSPTIFNCNFLSNYGNFTGGGMKNYSSSPVITNCSFNKNNSLGANAGYGGGIMNDPESSPQITNCVFWENGALIGSGICNALNSSPKIVNCTFSKNTSSAGVIVNLSSSSPNIINSIIYGNNSGISNTNSTPNISYSLVQGLPGGSNGNISGSTNPLFIFPPAGNYRLQGCSPAINAGNNALIPSGITTDLDGNGRINGGTVDMGAYEFFPSSIVITPNASGIVFVKKDIFIEGNGNSWASAVRELADALVAAKNNSAIQQIWVAKGTYLPQYDAALLSCNNVDNRNNAFVLVNNVRVYGGFDGTETTLSQRSNWLKNATILSGDIGTEDDRTDNSYHVVVSAGAVGTALLDGFYIRDGQASGSGSITVNSTSISRGDGAGIYISASSPAITNCFISGNASSGTGGGILGLNASSIFTNVVVTGNSAAGNGGGLWASNPGVSGYLRFYNCTVASNKAASGGGMYIASLSTNPSQIYNSIVYGNKTTGNVASNDLIAPGSTFPQVYRSIIGNTGGYSSFDANSTNNPLFITPADAMDAPSHTGNYRLQKCSPAINSGNNSYIPGGVATDIAGNNRILNTTVDRGAFEISSTLAVPGAGGIVYVNGESDGSGDGSSWDAPLKELADALKEAKNNSAVTQVWTAKGTYYPLHEAATLGCSPAIASDKAFVLVNNVKLYGGFAGGETMLTQRNPALNETILSGDIGITGNHADNAFHVVISAGAAGTAEINGFTIQDGRADSTGNLSVNGSNIARSAGAGMYLVSSSPAVSNCKILANASNNGGGGGIVASASGTVFSTCLVAGNSSLGLGGGLYSTNNGASALQYYNCTFTGNKGSSGGGMYIAGLSATSSKLYNCIVYGNETNAGGVNNDLISGAVAQPEVRYSTIGNTAAAGPYNSIAATGNSTANPLFIHSQSAALAPALSGNYRLLKCSPAINTGFNTYAPAGNDLDGNARIAFATVDRGAYEKVLSAPATNGIVYVDSSNTIHQGDGSSWAKAVPDLADALKAAKTNTAITGIWVAKGTYTPLYDATDNGSSLSCPTVNRDNSFVLVNNVKLYGGFAGGETDTTGRNFVTNETILSGDFSKNDIISGGGSSLAITNNTENAYNVVISAGAVGSAELNGFTVTKGNANNSVGRNVNGATIFRGGGGGFSIVQSSPLVSNTKLFGCYADYGGGIFTNLTSAIITNCLVVKNLSVLGGGMHNDQATATVKYCVFSENRSTNGGGGLFNYSGTPYITNCLFLKNVATVGGAIFNNLITENLIIRNCTIADNSGIITGGGISSNAVSTVIANCIIWGNISSGQKSINGAGLTGITNCIIEGGYAGGTNIYDTDPLFVDASANNYRLQPCSPAINIGNNGDVTEIIDLDGNSRIAFTDVDLGAYEVQAIDFASTTWRGYNSDWNNKINWCGGFIPANTTNVTVPATSNNPVIDAGFDNEVKNIALANTTSLTVANTSSFTINGTYANNGSTITNNGNWIMAGDSSNQTFPGALATVTAMNNLEVNNPSGLKFDKSFQLTGTLTPTAGNINVDNATITLHSDATATARVAEVPSGVAFSYTGTGKFEVERYIPPHRAWRLLTAPLNTATNLTISQAWQEGLSNANRLSPVIGTAGFGTTITKSTTYNVADGYDQGSTNSPSIRYYNGTNWGAVPLATNGTTAGANNGLISDQPGYMLFVRGDRGIQVAGVNVPATVTTLRPKGQLKTGPQTIVCNGWTVIGNPYASPINFHQIVLDNPGLPDVFYVWDANLAGSSNVGGWVSYGSYNNGTQTYTVAPLLAGSTFANNKGDISSGSAFMINYNGTITINENSKSTLGDNVLYRPAKQLRLSLLQRNADGSESVNDGFAIVMDGSPAKGNAIKNTNFTENLSVSHNGNQYAILNRPLPGGSDTIFISTRQMRHRQYFLHVEANDLNLPANMNVYLEDVYLRHYEPVATEGQTRYAFTVNTDSGSFAAGRLRLLFKKAPRFRQVLATAANQDIEVEWTMEEQFGIISYEVERSVNGIDFTIVGETNSNRHLQTVGNSWLDISPATGKYFYRIKAATFYGTVVFSDIVTASMVDSKEGMYVYPNPVTADVIQLRMNGQPPGYYSAVLTGLTGQKIVSHQWEHSGGSLTRPLSLPAFIAAGWYSLEIIRPGGGKEVIKVELQR